MSNSAKHLQNSKKSFYPKLLYYYFIKHMYLNIKTIITACKNGIIIEKNTFYLRSIKIIRKLKAKSYKKLF